MQQGEGMPKTAEIRRQNRGQAAENGEKRQDIKRAGTPTGKRGNPPEPLHYEAQRKLHLHFSTMPERMQYKA